MPPWVLRALVLTAVYGVGQAASVALRAWVPSLVTIWTLLVLGVVLAVGVVWAGAEVVLGRRPPEWTWFKAAFAAGPGAGLLTWILLALFVDGTTVTDLGAALVGRAAFTILLIVASAAVGTRLGWLSLRRRGQGDEDPALDRDGTDPGERPRVGRTTAGPAPADGPVLAPQTTERVARRRAAGGSVPASAPAGATAGAPGAAAGPAPTGSGTRRDRPETAREPRREPEPAPPLRYDPEFEPPVVAVLPTLPAREAGDRFGADPRSADAPREGDEDPDDADRPRRRRGLRRPEN